MKDPSAKKTNITVSPKKRICFGFTREHVGNFHPSGKIAHSEYFVVKSKINDKKVS